MTNHASPVTLRAMTEADFETADAVWRRAFATSTEFPQTTPTESELATALARRAHFLRNDPGGSFVAIVEDAVVGIAQSHRREGTFVLAMLAVAPEFQDAGIGHQLLSAALDYAEGARAAYIFSSSDPRAIHRYVRAGFALHPAVQITGRTARSGAFSHLRVSDGNERDLAEVEAIDRALRGSGRRIDVSFWLANGWTLLCHDDGGYAVLAANRLAALGSTNERVARELFAAVLAGFPDEMPRAASWIAGQQQWAIAEAAAQGATIEVHGSIMARGVERLPHPYLPNGLFG